jgi:glycosyltransferase involved in cell wall biosynthesis
MKIAYDIRPLLSGYNSGIPEYSYQMLKGLLAQDKRNEYALFFNSWQEAKIDLDKLVAGQAEIVRTNYPNKLFNYLMQAGLAWPKLDKLTHSDVFYMPHLNLAAFGSSAKRVITIHDLSFLMYPEFFSARKNLWHRALRVRENLRHFDHVIAVSEHTRQDIIELCGLTEDRVSTIYPGINEACRPIEPLNPILASVKRKYSLPEYFVLYLGTVEPRKNIEGLMRAFLRLKADRQEFAELKLVIAGAMGWKYQAVKNLADNPDIVLAGYIDQADKPALYNLAELFVFPSFYEGFGFPPLEAMAAGLPVVAAASSSLAEVCADAALLVDPYDERALTSAMAEMLSDQTLRKTYRDRGLAHSADFTWAKAATELLSILERVAGR